MKSTPLPARLGLAAILLLTSTAGCGSPPPDPVAGPEPRPAPSDARESAIEAPPSEPTPAAGQSTPPGPDAEEPSPELSALINRLRDDQQEQERRRDEEAAAAPQLEDLRREVETAARGFFDALARGDMEGAKECFLSDEQLDSYYPPASARILVANRSAGNFEEWQKFQASRTGATPVLVTARVPSEIALHEPRRTPGPFARTVYNVPALVLDYRIGDSARRLSLTHLLRTDEGWKMLRFELED